MKCIKQILLFTLSIVIILITATSISFAHPGRLDSNGGHYNRSTGEYHYHDGSHSSGGTSANSTYDDKDDYDYTTKGYGNSYFDETTTRNYYSSEDNKEAKKDSDSMSTGLLIFLIIISLVNFIIMISVIIRITDLDNTVSKRLFDIEQNNEKILNSINELSRNNIDYANGYDKGFNKATEDFTPQLIEKAYQMGIRDADKVKEERKRISEMFRQGIKVDPEIDTADSTYEYIKADNTIQTEPFVSVGQTLEEMLRVPKGIKITDNLKLVDTKYPNYKFGRYTVYKTKSGNKVHFEKGCCGANIETLSFTNDDRNCFNTCYKCFSYDTDKSRFFTPEWYKEFRNYKKKICFDKNSPYYKNIVLKDYEHDFENYND